MESYATIGGILVFVGALVSFIIWIMALVKAFKAGDIIWGILGIFIQFIPLIWLFVKGHTKLGILWIVAVVVAAVGCGMLFPSMMEGAQEGMEGIQQQLEQQPQQ